MQELHSIGGTGGRLFGGGGDRRLRQVNHPNNQALKCPRCDSINTKFCYYNNYNLSQPRHFCKNCRRYWTKGGVLRNVPVGGGIRKAKRSKPNPSSEKSKEGKSNSRSSSESSSLTASTTAVTTPAATGEVVSGSSSTTSASTIINRPESRFRVPQTTNPMIFPEIGSFTSMMSSSVEPSVLNFNVTGISQFGSDNENLKHQWNEEQKVLGDEVAMHDMSGGFVDNQTGEIEFPGLQNRTSYGGVASVDWQSGVDQSMFDLTATVDPSYWTHTQWTDGNDHHLNYLP